MILNETNQALVVMTFVVLLPLIPAVILYKFLPSTGDAQGPFKGLTVKFGGAFAGYLVLFLVLIAIRPVVDVHYHTWQVTGQLQFQHPPSEADPNVNDVMVRFVPPRLGVLHQGVFSWEIPVTEKNGVLLFPDLQIDLPGYRGLTVPLVQTRAYGAVKATTSIDTETRTISFDAPLTLQSVKQGQIYVETKATPAQLVPGIATPPDATAAAPSAPTGSGSK